MAEAREILADFVRRRAIPSPTDDDPDAIYFDGGHAREAIEALQAAGYRIIAPGQLCPETIEAAASSAEALTGLEDKGEIATARAIAKTIRALAREA